MMIYSVGQEPTTGNTTTQDPSSSRIVAGLPTENYFPAAEPCRQTLPVVEEPDSFCEAQTLTETQADKLAACILQRIEARLPCRIRNLRVSVTENVVVLEGRCSTYYTKQIAQHTAMGVLEYERLTNHIEVCSAK